VVKLSDAIMVALITGGISLFGSILTIVLTNRKQQQDLDRKIAVIETKMDDIKEDVRAHNKYAQMFSENVPAIKQHMIDVDRRLDNIERRQTA
jgi:uncharacterized membrane-anchored protein YhcB (DUF1043 family)